MSRFKLSLVVLAFLVVQPLQADPLLPAVAYTLQDVDATVAASIKLKINTYTEAKTSYAWDVYCPNNLTEKVGTVDFEYAPYTGDFDGGAGNDFGGAIIRGGFKAGPDICDPPAGATYRWLQHIIVTGDQTVDTIDGDPLYPNFTLAGYDALLFDAPGRGPLGTTFKNLSWLAESALVCVVGKDIYAIGSFLWGFDIKTDAGTTTVSSFVPQLWSSGVTASFATRFNAEFGASGTRDTGWTLKEGCCCIPEPSAPMLVLIGLPIIGWIKRRAA